MKLPTHLRCHMVIVGLMASLALMPGGLDSAEPITTRQFTQAVKWLSDVNTEAGSSDEWLTRVRLTTWRLLVGEIAGDEKLKLSSGSFDELTRGLKEFDQLLADLKENPQLERKLSEHVQLAMRLDATRARRPEIEKRRELSRKDELSRLSQLREINRSYRRLIGELVQSQTSLVTGHTSEVVSLGDSASRLFLDIESIVGQRRDFYLFDDEPELSIEPKQELNLVQELVQPIASDVRRHQMALQAYTLYQLATSTTEEPRTAEQSREKLMLARKLAETSVSDSNNPPRLAYWALGLVFRELGRLETIPDPWSETRHQRAAPLFELAKRNLTAAMQFVDGADVNAPWLAEVKDQLTELRSSEPALKLARTLLNQGMAHQSELVLTRCATLHRMASVAELLVDCRRLKADPFRELEEFTRQLWESGLLADQSVSARLIRGRQGVLRLWQTLSQTAPVENRPIEFGARLDQAISDLEFAVESGDNTDRIVADLYLALASVIELSIRPGRNLETARDRMNRIPLHIAELKQQQQEGLIAASWMVNEATISGWIAYGSLAIRFLDNYRDVAPNAFASAVDARAAAPKGLNLPDPLGTTILQSLLSRPEGADARLAAEEHFVRHVLESTFPAIAAMQLSPSIASATQLQSITRRLESNDIFMQQRSPLSLHDSLDARHAASRNVSHATILAYLSANEPVEAIREAIISLQLESAGSVGQTIDLKAIRRKILLDKDPIRTCIIALAIEEFATRQTDNGQSAEPDSKLREAIELALELQQIAKQLFDDSKVTRAAHPSECDMNRLAIRRLTEPDHYLRSAAELISEFRLTEARRSLDAGIRRHPDSVPLREAFVQTLIDEADLRPDQADDLIARAIAQLERLTSSVDGTSFSSLLKLAGLYERTSDHERASSVYRNVCTQSLDDRQRLVARSRLAALQMRKTAR